MNYLIKKKWDYTLAETNGAYKLSVMCGTVGAYELEFILNESEINQYLKSGDKFIETLANDVREHPSKYKERKVSVDS
jgi:hypothetical protein